VHNMKPKANTYGKGADRMIVIAIYPYGRDEARR